MELNIYLGFPGNCREAMEFYHKTLGGELQEMMTYGNAPEDCGTPEGWEDKIMHVTLSVGGLHLMGSDLTEGHYQPPATTNVSINV
ncbi:MAG: hypothetical protein Alpg2KO_20710 [Alphaproteobacteria bacterium]